jgi:hypothetical protein
MRPRRHYTVKNKLDFKMLLVNFPQKAENFWGFRKCTMRVKTETLDEKFKSFLTKRNFLFPCQLSPIHILHRATLPIQALVQQLQICFKYNNTDFLFVT